MLVPTTVTRLITKTYHFALLFSLYVLLSLNGFQQPAFAQIQSQQENADIAPRWWKGNLHTHSLWSDGDDFPEMIAAWYLDHDYNFLALSDHNILSDGIRWMKLDSIAKRTKADVLKKYRARFGADWVETRTSENGSGTEVRLKPLDEFGPLLAQAGKFIMIPGEEISDRAEGKPVHMNATNLRDLIEPVGGATVQEVMRNNLRSVLEHEKSSGREILPHLNHPNFGYAVTAEDLANVLQERFFEVYNGHPGVNQLGNKEHISIERMWDVANAIRVFQLDGEPLMGIATDDSHKYHSDQGSTPGRGWVMVRSKYLSPEHLIRAMKLGDFYASSGVELADFSFESQSRTMKLKIIPEPGVTYRTEFIGTSKPVGDGLPAEGQIGKVLFTSRDLAPEFSPPPETVVLRARVSSTKNHPNGSIPNQFTQAWTQPIVLSATH